MAVTLEMLQGEGGFSALSGCGEFDPTCGPLRLASMRYDYRDQMVEYEETFGSGAFVRFQYDALGRRVSRLSLDSATYYVQGGQSSWQVLAEYDGPAATASLKADYVYGNYIDEPIQMRRDYDGSGPGALQTFYYHQDDLFNVVALTAGPGGVSVPSLGTFPSGAVVERYRYGDYGLPSFVTGDGNATMESARTGNPYLFTGREWDGQSRLYHYRTRYMEPTWGRFTTRDTIGIWGDSANRGNGYEYVGGGPTVAVDPYGEKSSRTRSPKDRGRDPGGERTRPTLPQRFKDTVRDTVREVRDFAGDVSRRAYDAAGKLYNTLWSAYETAWESDQCLQNAVRNLDQCFELGPTIPGCSWDSRMNYYDTCKKIYAYAVAECAVETGADVAELGLSAGGLIKSVIGDQTIDKLKDVFRKYGRNLNDYLTSPASSPLYRHNRPFTIWG